MSKITTISKWPLERRLRATREKLKKFKFSAWEQRCLLEVTLEEFKKRKALLIFDQVSGNISHAARKLGISRRQLYRLLNAYLLGCEGAI